MTRGSFLRRFGVPHRRFRSPGGGPISEFPPKSGHRGGSAPRAAPATKVGADSRKPVAQEPETLTKSKSLPPKNEAQSEEEKKKLEEKEEQKRLEFEERLRRLPTPGQPNF